MSTLKCYDFAILLGAFSNQPIIKLCLGGSKIWRRIDTFRNVIGVLLIDSLNSNEWKWKSKQRLEQWSDNLIVLCFTYVRRKFFVINLETSFPFFRLFQSNHGVKKANRWDTYLLCFDRGTVRVDGENCSRSENWKLCPGKVFLLLDYNVKTIHESWCFESGAFSRGEEKREHKDETQLQTIESQREDDSSAKYREKNFALMITTHYTRRRCSNEL